MGGLTEKVRRKPYSLVLFDEIEKAHPDVLNLLLQLLEDGRLTDSHGRVIDFKNTVIIMTSNIGARLITEKKTLGFKSSKEDEVIQYEEVKKEVMQELKRNLRPEFINRIDDIIVFNRLGEEEIIKITDLMIREVEKKLIDKDIKLEISDEAKKAIVKKVIDKNYGARPLRRVIQNEIEDKLAELLLNNKIDDLSILTIYEEEGEIRISKK